MNGQTPRVVRYRALALVGAVSLAMAAAGSGTARAAERASGPLAVERVDLRFAGGEKVRVVAAGTAMRAEAEITFRGSGELAGAWEIADPGTTGGSAQFRTLELVNRLMSLGKREVLASPPLPTAAVGAYVLRLRVERPQADTGNLALSYFVGQAGGAPATAGGAAFEARGPAPGSGPKGMAFSWTSVPGSIAYQVEIYEKEAPAAQPGAEATDAGVCLLATRSPLARPPVTGVMAPGTATEVMLGPLAARRLAPGRAYLWRLAAIGEGGTILCESPLRDLER
jgi:hypothetical protein